MSKFLVIHKSFANLHKWYINSPAFQGWEKEMVTQGEAVHGLTRKNKGHKWPQNGLGNSIIPSPKGLGYGLKTIIFAKVLLFSYLVI